MTQARLGGSRLTMAAKTLESQCAWCKCVFLHTHEHAYKGCCSWGCLCKLREKEEKNKKSRRTKLIIRTEEQALARIEVCKEKIKYFESLKADMVINQRNKKSTTSSLWEWRCKLNDAERTLKILRGEMDEDDVDE